MSPRLALVVCFLLALATPVALAADISLRIEADEVDDVYVWLAGGVVDPDYVIPAGANVTFEVVTLAGFHNLHVKAPVGAKSADVATPDDPTTTFSFTAPASGSAVFVCDYHTTMDGTMTFSATATEVSTTSGMPKRTPLPWPFALAAIALVAAARRR